MFLHAHVDSAKTHILHPIYFIHESYCFWHNLPNTLGNLLYDSSNVGKTQSSVCVRTWEKPKTQFLF